MDAVEHITTELCDRAKFTMCWDKKLQRYSTTKNEKAERTKWGSTQVVFQAAGVFIV
jgi:hypothetical protein